jgi:exosortase/archaeosortase family protein
MVGVMLLPFGYKPMVIGQYLSLNGLKSPLLVEIAWNCIGWQSFIILLLTLLPGLSGNFSPVSKFKAAIVGVLGTFLLNLIRISVVLIIVFHLGSAPALLFHDYAGSFLSILWLFIFWWFSYQYILEEKMTVSSAAKNVSSE